MQSNCNMAFDVQFCGFANFRYTTKLDFSCKMSISDGAIVKCTFTSHTAWVSGVAWAPHNEYLFLSGAYDNMLKLWDTRR